MNPYIAVLPSIETLVGIGIGLVLIGVIYANLNRRHYNLFSFRSEDSDQLRKTGDTQRADRIDAATVISLRRIRIFGRVLIVAGVAAILSATFLSA